MAFRARHGRVRWWHSTTACTKPATSRARTWRSNTAGPRVSMGGDLKQMSIVRRGLPLREHALACPINLKAVDDALQWLLQTKQLYHNAIPNFAHRSQAG